MVQVSVRYELCTVLYRTAANMHTAVFHSKRCSHLLSCNWAYNPFVLARSKYSRLVRPRTRFQRASLAKFLFFSAPGYVLISRSYALHVPVVHFTCTCSMYFEVALHWVMFSRGPDKSLWLRTCFSCKNVAFLKILEFVLKSRLGRF